MVITVFFASLGSCGPRAAPDSKRRAVDGHLARVISDQIPRHGSIYSGRQIEIMRARLALNPNDIAARQTNAEALTRIGKFDEALVELNALEQARPDRFETSYLRARARDGMGDLQGALSAAEEAIKQRSSGHDDMADYFVKMFRWRAADAAGDAAGQNFLGIPYDSGPEAVANLPDFSQQNLAGLLEAFPQFFDGHMVLGDWLTSQDSDQLAVRAYLRALSLARADTDKQRINQRLSTLESKWNARAESSPELVFNPDYRERIEQEFKDAAAWRMNYKLVEQELARALPQPPALALAADDAGAAEKVSALRARNQALAALKLPDVELVLQEMKLRGHGGPAYYQAGLAPAKPSPWLFLFGGSPHLWAGAGIATLVVVFFYRRVARERRDRRYKL